MKMRIAFVRVLMLSTAVGMLVACGLDMPKEKQTSFETLTVKKEDITTLLKFSAKMKGQSDVTITPQVSGQLMKICVTEGQQVHRGQTLFVIDSRNAQHEVEAAHANLQAAQANLTAAQAQANSAKLEYESNQNLFNKKIVSSYMLDNSRNSYNQAQAAVSQAKASVAQAQSALNRAKVNLGFCTITAPVTGVIGEISVRSYTGADANTIMKSVVQPLEENINGVPGMTYITSLTGVVDASTGSLACKASFPNPDGHLYSGVQGTVLLPYSQKNVMVIPQTAVVRLQDKSLVYKVKPDSTATAIAVTYTDAGNGKDFIVTSGLNVGEQIVTVGANNLQEGQKVLFPDEE